MADRRSYLVDPATGQASVVALEDIKRAEESGWTPASKEQRVALDAQLAAEADPLGGVKAFAEKAVGALPPVALAGIPAALTAVVPSIDELRYKQGTPEYEGARQERERLARTLAKYTTPSGIAQTLGLTTEEAIKAREEQYPVASGLGTVAGMLSPVVATSVAKRLPGAIGEAARAGAALAAEETAAAAALEAGNVEGVTLAQRALAAAPRVQALEAAAKQSKTAQLIDAASGRQIFEGTKNAFRRAADVLPGLSNASPVAKDIVAKSLALPVGSAIEGALYRTGQIADETALGRQDLSAEKILSEISEDALFSGGIAGALGLGVAGAYKTIKGARAATSKIRDYMVDRFPEFSASVTGGDVDDIRYITQRRAEIKQKGLRDLIGERVAMPEAPTLREVSGPEPMVTPPLRSTIPMPEAPVKRTVPTVAPEALRPSEANKVAKELSDMLEARKSAMDGLEMYANAELRKIEMPRLIKMRLQRQTKELEQGMMESLAGRTPSFAEDIMLEQIRSGEAAAKPYRDAAEGLLGNARSLYGMTDDPAKYPSVVRRAMGDFVERFESFLAANPEPDAIHSKIKKLKQEVFDMPAGKTREEMAQIAAAKRDAGGAFNRLYGQFAEFLSDVDLWGFAGKREAEFNRMLTERDPIKREHLKGFFKKVAAPGGKTVYEVDREGIATAIKQLRIDPVTKTPDESSVAFFNNLNRLLSSDSKVIEEVERTAQYANENFNKEMLEATLQEVRRTIGNAADEGLLRAANAAKKAEAKLAQVERRAEVAKANEEFAAAKAEYKRLEGLATEDARAARAELEQVIDSQRRTIEAYKEQRVAAAAEFSEAKSLYQEMLKERNADIDARLKTLGAGASAGGLKDALGIIGTGALVGKFVSPFLAVPIEMAAGSLLLASNPAKTLKTFAELERLIQKTNAKIDVGVSKLTGIPTRVTAELPVSSLAVGSATAERAKFREIAKTITALQRDDDLSSHLEDSTGPLRYDAPGISTNADATTSRAAMYLAGNLPKPPPNLPPMLATKWEPSDAQVREFNTLYRTVDQPTSILADAGRGTLVRKQVEAVSVVYPELTAEIRQRIIDGLEENPNISAPRRRVISMILGVDIDGQTGPQIGMAAQSVYGSQPQEPQGAQLKAYQGRALNMDSRSARETSEWRKAQEGVGRWNRIGRRTQ